MLSWSHFQRKLWVSQAQDHLRRRTILANYGEILPPTRLRYIKKRKGDIRLYNTTTLGSKSVDTRVMDSLSWRYVTPPTAMVSTTFDPGVVKSL